MAQVFSCGVGMFNVHMYTSSASLPEEESADQHKEDTLPSTADNILSTSVVGEERGTEGAETPPPASPTDAAQPTLAECELIRSAYMQKHSGRRRSIVMASDDSPEEGEYGMGAIPCSPSDPSLSSLAPAAGSTAESGDGSHTGVLRPQQQEHQPAPCSYASVVAGGCGSGLQSASWDMTHSTSTQARTAGARPAPPATAETHMHTTNPTTSTKQQPLCPQSKGGKARSLLRHDESAPAVAVEVWGQVVGGGGLCLVLVPHHRPHLHSTAAKTKALVSSSAPVSRCAKNEEKCKCVVLRKVRGCFIWAARVRICTHVCCVMRRSGNLALPPHFRRYIAC